MLGSNLVQRGVFGLAVTRKRRVCLDDDTVLLTEIDYRPLLAPRVQLMGVSGLMIVFL